MLTINLAMVATFPCLIALLLFSEYADSQQKTNTPVTTMESRADAFSQKTDKEIAAGKYYKLEIRKKDSTESARVYFIDTAKGLIVKAIMDTNFIDHFGIPYKQVITYFNSGFEYKNCYVTSGKIDVCSYFNLLPAKDEIKDQPGLLENDWKTSLDPRICRKMRSDIFFMKVMQKKYN